MKGAPPTGPGGITSSAPRTSSRNAYSQQRPSLLKQKKQQQQVQAALKEKEINDLASKDRNGSEKKVNLNGGESSKGQSSKVNNNNDGEGEGGVVASKDLSQNEEKNQPSKSTPVSTSS